MTNATIFRTAILAALVVLTMPYSSIVASATDKPRKDAPPETKMHDDQTAETLSLGVGKSVVIDLPEDIKDILVADPKIANAVVRSSRRAYIIGVAVGQTNVYFFNSAGKQITGYDIAVTRDLNGIRALLKRTLPGADIRVDGMATGIVLSGSAANPVEAQQAYDLATRLAGDSSKVVNSITVKGRDQVMLKVTVAEVRREVIKQLGINLDVSLTRGQTVLDFVNNNPFSVNQPLVPGNGLKLSFRGVDATLRAMERAGVIRTLAEPTLTAISGEPANFLAGGEFPVVTGSTCQTPTSCTATVTFKKFGVSLSFTPVVLTEGRISMKVGTEVSELSTEGALQTQGLTIPSIAVRRVDSSVEIPSGGSLALAGLIGDQTKQQINGMPGLMNLPVLGALFKSRDYQTRQTELMVLVTPYVVRAVAQKDLSRPDDGFVDASDPATTLLGRFNRIYGRPGHANSKPQRYRGNVGFILD